MRTPTPVLAAVALVLATAACAPENTTSSGAPSRASSSGAVSTTAPSSGQPTSSTPATVYTCTPSPGQTKTCSAADHDAEVAQQALVAEAEAVYRRFHTERVRLILAGGAVSATPVLSDTGEGQYLSDVLALLRYEKEQAQTRVGDIPLKFGGLAEPVDASALITLRICEDGRETTTYDSSGLKISNGSMLATRVSFKRFGGTLKVFAGTAERVDACAF